MSYAYDLATVVKKELKVGFRDPLTTIARSIIMPLIFLIFFGFGLGGTFHDLPVAVVSESGGQLSASFVDSLNSENLFQITQTSYRQALELFDSNQVKAIVYLPADFGSSREVSLIMDRSVPNIANNIEIAIKRKASELGGVRVSGASISEEVMFGRNMQYVDFFAPSIIIMVIIFSAIFCGGLSLMYDREFGTLKSLLVAPINPGTIVLGKTIGGVLQAMVSVYCSLLLFTILGVHVNFSVNGLLLFSGITFIAAIGFIGMSVAVACKTYRFEQLTIIMLITNFPLWLLSGAIYPVESMPAWMGFLSKINPLTYLLEAMRLLLTRNIIEQTLVFDTIVVGAYAAIMYLAGVVMFKKTIG